METRRSISSYWMEPGRTPRAERGPPQAVCALPNMVTGLISLEWGTFLDSEPRVQHQCLICGHFLGTVFQNTAMIHPEALSSVRDVLNPSPSGDTRGQEQRTG